MKSLITKLWTTEAAAGGLIATVVLVMIDLLNGGWHLSGDQLAKDVVPLLAALGLGPDILPWRKLEPLVGYKSTSGGAQSGEPPAPAAGPSVTPPSAPASPTFTILRETAGVTPMPNATVAPPQNIITSLQPVVPPPGSTVS